ncbi:MAG: hypothetical protein GX802_06535 [Clostridiales bacterium]|jgi:hypothetical protein|nr:hypothetical protein [Clostridiales bacterium]
MNDPVFTKPTSKSLNLVNKTAQQGARTVVGFYTAIYRTEGTIWGMTFMQALYAGQTIEQAIVAADNEVEKPGNHTAPWEDGEYSTTHWYIAGVAGDNILCLP